MFQRFLRFLFPFLSVVALAQPKDSSLRVFRRVESELQALQKNTFFNRDENVRTENNKEFIALWDQIVNDPEILNYSFDSLKEVSVLRPRDGSFKLITWNQYRNDGSYFYFGYLLVNRETRIKKGWLKTEKKSEFTSYKLIDRSATVKAPENYTGSTDKWFGMLYYELIDCGDYYVLLGYDPNDKLTRRKFVDVLSFKSNGMPVFGKDVFRFPRKNPRRLMFEYSSDVVMSLKYDHKRQQIVFSHLASGREDKVLEGQTQYYGPDGSYDALELHKGRWNLIEDVDVRNERSPNDNVKKPNPKKQTPIFKPK